MRPTGRAARPRADHRVPARASASGVGGDASAPALGLLAGYDNVGVVRVGHRTAVESPGLPAAVSSHRTLAEVLSIIRTSCALV
jgi:hypothetical protein